MPSPLPFLTPYRTPDYSGMHKVFDRIMEKRRMAQQQAQFEASQAQAQQFHNDALEQQMLARQQADQHFQSEQQAARDAAALAYQQKRDAGADEVLKEYSKAAATGDEAAIRALAPWAARRGVTLEWQTKPEVAPGTQDRVVLPQSPELSLPEPKFGQSASGKPPLALTAPFIPGMAAPTLREPQMQTGYEAGKFQPDEMSKILAPKPLPKPAPQGDVALRPQPAYNQIPTRTFDLTYRGAPLGGPMSLDKQDKIAQSGIDEADRVWAGVSNEPEARMAQIQTERMYAPKFGAEKAAVLAQQRFAEFMGRMAAQQRAETMQQGQMQRAQASQSKGASKEDQHAFEWTLDKTIKEYNVPKLQEAEAAARNLVAFAGSDNPAAQTKGILQYIQLFQKGALTDKDQEFSMRAQSKADQLYTIFKQWEGDPQQAPEFLETLEAFGVEMHKDLRRLRMDAATTARNRMLSTSFSTDEERLKRAAQAEEFVLGVGPGDRQVPSRGGNTQESSSQSVSSSSNGPVDDTNLISGGGNLGMAPVPKLKGGPSLPINPQKQSVAQRAIDAALKKK